MTKTVQLRQSMDAFGMLRRLARASQRPSTEHCELCNASVSTEHRHLVDLTQRRLICTCEACAMLFSGRTGTKYKRVPRTVRMLTNFRMTDADWDSLLIPINLAFFFQSSFDSRVSALYPSPAGATESLLSLEAWSRIEQTNPALSQLEADVEALLVNRVGQARGSTPAEYYIVPIDFCYQLVGLIRIHWRGLSGGSEVWQHIGNFFEALRAKAEVVTEDVRA